MLLQYSVLLAGLIAGSITDLRTREVPDWINYGLIAAGFGINALASIIMNNYSIILFSVLGFAVFFALSHLMYNTGQWGGGDAKMLMGIGALLGFQISIDFPFMQKDSMIIAFLSNLVVAGFIYGMMAAVLIALKNRKKFWKQLQRDLERFRKIRIIMLIGCLIILSASFLAVEQYMKLLIVALAAITFFSFYIWVFTKAVENSCMYRLIAPEKLTEGDWIAREIVVGGKIIASPKDLGIEKGQIRELIKLKKRGKIKKVLIKEGIPFVPSFLIAFVMSLVFGNVLFRFI